MKKTRFFAAACALSFFLTSGCVKKNEIRQARPAETSSGISVVCTTFPLYDWTRRIAEGAEGTSVSFIEDSGVDLHNFKPSANDIIRIQTGDLFIFTGGESDGWADEALLGKVRRSLRLFDMDFARIAEDDDDAESAEDDGEEETDEHVWLSLRNAAVFCGGITDALCSIDLENELLYRKNLSDYVKQLEELDRQFVSLFAEKKNPVLIVCDRFPFAYFAYDYSVPYIAAFNGCSAETEASFEKIAMLSKAVNDYSAVCVYVLSGSSRKIADTVIQNSARKDCAVYELDSMQGISAADVKNGATYLGCFRNNYEVLKKSLE